MPKSLRPIWSSLLLAVCAQLSFSLEAASVLVKVPPPEGTIVKAVIEEVGKRYVDPSRVDPAEMLRGGARAMDREVPEVVLDAPSADGSISLEVAGIRRTFSTAGVRTLRDLVPSARELLQFVNEHQSPSSEPKAEYVLINGMLETLDPHSVIFDPKHAREFARAVSNRISGIGIVIGDSSASDSGAAWTRARRRCGTRRPSWKGVAFAKR